jgi:hypothetical protein
LGTIKCHSNKRALHDHLLLIWDLKTLSTILKYFEFFSHFQFYFLSFFHAVDERFNDFFSLSRFSWMWGRKENY